VTSDQPISSGPTLTFAERLSRWRQRSRLTQDEASAALGIGRSYYNRLEGDRKKPGRFLVEKFNLIEHAPVALVHTGEPAPANGEPPRSEREMLIARLIEKILRIEREGSPEQIEMLDAAIESQLKLARRRIEQAAKLLIAWSFLVLQHASGHASALAC
jgi:transcriptional regulator with XRE-family HTH domain